MHIPWTHHPRHTPPLDTLPRHTHTCTTSTSTHPTRMLSGFMKNITKCKLARVISNLKCNVIYYLSVFDAELAVGYEKKKESLECGGRMHI